MAKTAFEFYLPPELNASHPPERRGIRRDHVRMMVMDRKTGAVSHDRFFHLVNYIQAGDIIVLNNSRTVPAILKAISRKVNSHQGEPVEVRLAKRKSEDTWEVLIVAEDIIPGDTLEFSPLLSAIVIRESNTSPLMEIRFSLKGTKLLNAIYSLGEPVRYEYINYAWDLDYYQTVFASQPGSVEMPSAGRAFSWELLFKLQRKGVKLGFIQLHTGLSYLLDDKWEQSPTENYEEYHIEPATMDLILKTKAAGGRVIAVGTTAVRALEAAVVNVSLSGWTNLYINSDYSLKIADGIITGFHEPKASHLDMLSAFVSPHHLFAAYEQAIQNRYLWHEFGDINMIL
ncbi:S-adenosylmethionine:tRNA ribosyltransferase-isomerase [Bacillus sp. T33-2]|uniref:S-adenosylmethionine:tRNA ribosyltransferase-isomerase n=1 Tax=Bacillus sp. T33-2 TaxID=2054168 RepID=UPI002155395F|nr:S-adenosylmethionine:tRNA ribosyltransferase-isomerase [Bacillus sp. T33-2]